MYRPSTERPFLACLTAHEPLLGAALTVNAFAPSALRGVPVPNGRVEVVGRHDADHRLISPSAQLPPMRADLRARRYRPIRVA